jgi:hypothetical protein
MFAGAETFAGATLLVRDPQNKVPTFRQRLDENSAVPTFREQSAADAAPVIAETAPLQPAVDAPQADQPVIESAPPSKPAADHLALEADGPVVVDETGFGLTLTKVPDGIDWSTAKLTSTHPILALNTSKFTVEAPLTGSRTVLRLKRDAAALPDAVYGVLTEMLCDSASVPLRFDFASGLPVEVGAKFTRKEDPEADDTGSPASGVIR